MRFHEKSLLLNICWKLLNEICNVWISNLKFDDLEDEEVLRIMLKLLEVNLERIESISLREDCSNRSLDRYETEEIEKLRLAAKRVLVARKR